MARGLLCRILDFMLQQGWLKRGDTVLDPFSGVGTTAIEAASRGIRAVGVELEERFHLLGLANMELHRRTWATFGDPHPVLLRGDSRRLPAEAAMTEAEWLASDDPTAMLEAITKRDMPRGGTISDRKLRLFTEACRADASSPPTAAQAAALLRDICGNPYRPVAIPCTRQAFVGDWLTPTIGASGAVFGVMVAFAMLFPEAIILMFFIFPMKAKYAVMIFVALELLATRAGNTGVSTIAHLGGAACGYVTLRQGPTPRFKLPDLTGYYRQWRMKRAKRKFQVYMRKHGRGPWVN